MKKVGLVFFLLFLSVTLLSVPNDGTILHFPDSDCVGGKTQLSWVPEVDDGDDTWKAEWGTIDGVTISDITSGKEVLKWTDKGERSFIVEIEYKCGNQTIKIVKDFTLDVHLEIKIKGSKTVCIGDKEVYTAELCQNNSEIKPSLLTWKVSGGSANTPLTGSTTLEVEWLSSSTNVGDKVITVTYDGGDAEVKKITVIKAKILSGPKKVRFDKTISWKAKVSPKDVGVISWTWKPAVTNGGKVKITNTTGNTCTIKGVKKGDVIVELSYILNGKICKVSKSLEVFARKISESASVSIPFVAKIETAEIEKKLAGIVSSVKIDSEIKIIDLMKTAIKELGKKKIEMLYLELKVDSITGIAEKFLDKVKSKIQIGINNYNDKISDGALAITIALKKASNALTPNVNVNGTYQFIEGEKDVGDPGWKVTAVKVDGLAVAASAKLTISLDVNISLDLKPLAVGFGISFNIDPKLDLELNMKLGTGPGNITPIDSPTAVADVLPNYTLTGTGSARVGGILKFEVGGSQTASGNFKRVSKKIEAGVE